MIRRASDCDEAALADLFSRYRNRLRKMVRLRLDRRVQGRIDPSDVLQQAYLDLAKELPKYRENPSIPFFLWLRMVTGQCLMRMHRRHLGTRMRDASCEVSLFRGTMPQASSISLAARLMGQLTSASQAAIRAEIQLQLQEALNRMDDIDREIIALRNFEELGNKETAEVLGLTPSAASKRYVRALMRLQGTLKAIPGFMDQSTS